MIDWTTELIAQHPQWLGLVLFSVACLECLAIAGLLVPGTVLLFGLAVLAGSGALSLWQTLLLGYCGGLLGDGLSYAIGRRFHGNIRRLPWLRSHPQWLDSAELHFQRYGVVSLLVGRFIGPLRPMLPMVAGMLDMPLVRFIGVSLVAAAGWSLAYLLPGWATGAAMRLPLPDGFWRDVAIVGTFLALVLGLIAHGSLRRRRWTTLLGAGLCLLALAALLLGWSRLQALDQGLMTLVQEQRNLWLDRYMVILTRCGDIATQIAAGMLLTVILLLNREWRATLFVGGALVGTAASNYLLKHLLARSRPEVLLEPLTSSSLPSGHSSAAFALFLTLGLLAGRGQPPRWRLTWLLLASLPALAIALSRVYLGAHWPTDIIAGALLAGTLCAASLGLVQWRMPLAPLPARCWWMILPLGLALLGFFGLWAVPETLQRYAY